MMVGVSLMGKVRSGIEILSRYVGVDPDEIFLDNNSIWVPCTDPLYDDDLERMAELGWEWRGEEDDDDKEACWVFEFPERK